MSEPAPGRRSRLEPTRALVLVVLMASSAHADAWVAPDKGLHFGVSVGLATAISLSTMAWLDSRAERFGVAFTAALALGLAKEVLDAWSTGSPSFRDLAWDAAGALVGALLGFVVERFLVTPVLEAVAPRFG